MKTPRLPEQNRSGPAIDLDGREIRHTAGSWQKLSRIESALLSCLMDRMGRPVSREELLTGVWRLDPMRTATRTVDMHVSMLRRKLGDNSRRPSMLVTVHGIGYMMQATPNPS